MEVVCHRIDEVCLRQGVAAVPESCEPVHQPSVLFPAHLLAAGARPFKDRAAVERDQLVLTGPAQGCCGHRRPRKRGKSGRLLCHLKKRAVFMYFTRGLIDTGKKGRGGGESSGTGITLLSSITSCTALLRFTVGAGVEGIEGMCVGRVARSGSRLQPALGFRCRALA